MNRCDKNAWFQLCSWAADRYSTALSQQPSPARAAIAALFIFHWTWHKVDTEGNNLVGFLKCWNIYSYLKNFWSFPVNYWSFKSNGEFDTFRYTCTRLPNCVKKGIPFCTHFSLNMLSALLSGDPHHHSLHHPSRFPYLEQHPRPSILLSTYCRYIVPKHSFPWFSLVSGVVCSVFYKYLALLHRETTSCIRPVSPSSIHI